MPTDAFWSDLDEIDKSLSQVSVNRPLERNVTQLLIACRKLQGIVLAQHEQIVDLNSRVEYGYTRKELVK